MGKISGVISLKQNNEFILNNYKINGIKTDKKICYIEKDINVSITIGENITINRKSNEHEITLPFVLNKNSKGKYLLREYNKIILLNIETTKLDIDDNKIEIGYKLDNNLFEYELNYEVK